MKKLATVFLALTMVLVLAIGAAAATPADHGWSSESEFAGWTTAEDGSMTLVYNDGSGVNDNRILHAIDDPQNFTITVQVDSETNSRPVINLFGICIELNAENGNGNQFFVKNFDGSNWNNFDWLNANECKVSVVLSRENGGNLLVTVNGEGNETPITMDIAIPEPDSAMLALQMYGCGNHEKGGIATFHVTFPAAVEPDTGNDPEPDTGNDPEPDTGSDPDNTADPIALVFATMLAAGGVMVFVQKKLH